VARCGGRLVSPIVRPSLYRPELRVLEIGCGAGRLPIGLLGSDVAVDEYWGVDVREDVVRWCQRHITARNPSFHFVHVDAQNARYDPDGRAIGNDFRLPVESGSFDVIYLYSVFSHMLSDDVRAYLSEFDRLLGPDGRVFFTGFVEDNVPDASVNPGNYRMAWHGPLHCVRYERSYLEELAAEAGSRIDRLDHAIETDGQSGLYMTRQQSARDSSNK
jgi:SAM-dependent methyltransferase